MKDTNICEDDTVNQSPIPLQPLNDTVIKRVLFLVSQKMGWNGWRGLHHYSAENRRTCPSNGCTFDELLLLLLLFPPFMFQHKALKLSHLVLTINFLSSFMITAALSQSGRHRCWWWSAVSGPAIAFPQLWFAALGHLANLIVSSVCVCVRALVFVFANCWSAPSLSQTSDLMTTSSVNCVYTAMNRTTLRVLSDPDL